MPFLLMAQPFFNLYAETALAPINTLIKIQINNGVKIYKNVVAVQEIFQLVVKYLFI